MFNSDNHSTGFYSNELSVIRETRFIIPDKRYFFENDGNDGNYNIIYIHNGSFTLECGNTITEMSHGDFAITRPYERFSLYTKRSSNSSTIIEFATTIISFNPSLFAVTKGDENFLRAFNERNVGKYNIFKKDDFGSTNFGERIINQLTNYSAYNLGFYHFKAAVAMLITQISLIFDKRHNENSVETSNEYKLKVYDYILRNTCNNISIDAVSKKFSVSSWYINNVTKKFYGKSFRKMVQSERMFRSRTMMRRQTDLSEISRLVGYSTYSGFYRNYLNYFGITPRKDYVYYKKYGDFYNKHSNEKKKTNDFI